MKECGSIILFLFFSAIQSIAGNYNINNINMVHLADSNKYVCNPDLILNRDSVAIMDKLLHSLELKTGIEVVVVAVEKLETECYNFALGLGNKYGIGKKSSNNGLVIVLSTKDRCIQFVTGRGLEGDLPDAICKKIQLKYMNDLFSEEKWSEGMTNGIRAVCKHLEGASFSQDQEEGSARWLLAVVIIVIFAIFFTGRDKKCPICKKRKLKIIKETVISSNNHSDMVEVLYKCSNCSHTETRRITKEKNDCHSGSDRWGGGLGSGFGLGRGFGGNSGGSFGGGIFGGGGSGSKF